jgi:hypothetical protein
MFMGRRHGIKFINLFSIYTCISAKAAEFKCSPSWRAICAAAPRFKRLAYHAIDKPLIFYGTPVVLFYRGQHAKVKRVYKRALQFIFRYRWLILDPCKMQLLNVYQQLR